MNDTEIDALAVALLERLGNRGEGKEGDPLPRTGPNLSFQRVPTP